MKDAVRHRRGVQPRGLVYSGREMTLVAILMSTLRRGLRPLAALVCLVGILTAQVALAADQVEDLAALGTHLVAGDGCAPDAMTSGDAEDHEPGTPLTHCQSCCFHHNGQTQAAAIGIDHAGNAGGARLALGRADPLMSAALSAEKDPPRA